MKIKQIPAESCTEGMKQPSLSGYTSNLDMFSSYFFQTHFSSLAVAVDKKVNKPFHLESMSSAVPHLMW